jgi:hypothetical protein
MDGIEFINFPCPECQSRQRAAKHLVGRTLTCMVCRKAFQVPAESSLEPVPAAERNSKDDFALPAETSSGPLPETPLTLPPASEAAVPDEFADVAPAEAGLADALPADEVQPADALALAEPALGLEGDAAILPQEEAAIPVEGDPLQAEAAIGGEPGFAVEGELQLADEAPADAAPVAAAEPAGGLEGELAPAPAPELDVSLVGDDVLALAPEEPAPAPNPSKAEPAVQPK